MSLVLDGSAVLAWCFRDETTLGIDALMARVADRDGTLADWDIRTDFETYRYAWTTTRRLADRFGLTSYDASYLELAQRLGLPLASREKALRAAAAGAGVDLLGG